MTDDELFDAIAARRSSPAFMARLRALIGEHEDTAAKAEAEFEATDAALGRADVGPGGYRGE